MKKNIDILKPHLSEFLQEEFQITNLHKNFRCISKTHEDKNPSMSYNSKEHYVKCFSCGYVGNIITVASDHWGISKKEAVSELMKKYDLEPQKNSFISYLKSRGLSEKTISHYQLKYEQDFKASYTSESGEKQYFSMGEAVKIPADKNSDFYLVRSINKKKFYKPQSVSEPIFFLSELKQKEPVFITESPFCAMSIWQCGAHAVALNGTGHLKLLRALSERSAPPPLIITLDKDNAGQRASERLYEELVNEGYQVINYPVSADKKDPNELLVSDPEKLKSEIANAINQVTALNHSKSLMKDYIAYSFLDEIERKKELISKRSSGFAGIDSQLNGFSEGLYILGGRPGVGKTTFLDQLAYNLAKTDPVLYFSYEQQKLHFAAKQLSRLSYQFSTHPFQSRNLLAGNVNSVYVNEMMKKYLDDDRNIHVYSEQYTVEDLQDKIERFEAREGKSPIIIIDFIQKIPVFNKTSAKDSVDYVVANLERFTHEGRRTVILVSSFNRAGYYNPISIDSFRETGNLEYAADVILGLQYHVLSENAVFKLDNKLSEKQSIIKAEELKKVREIDIVCSKNRYGTQFSIPMLYRTEYDIFEEKQRQIQQRI